jgi:hypothetical protein
MPLNLRQIVEKRGEASFEYLNETVNIVYRADRITKEFRAEALRLNREVLKAERRLNHLLETVNLVVAADGTIEADSEDAAAQEAIREVVLNDEHLKYEIDLAVASILMEWDIVGTDGKMAPIFTLDPNTKTYLPSDELRQIPADFEGQILSAIMNQNNLGEAQGAMPLTNSASTSRRVVKLETSRRARTGTHTSRRRGTSRQ